MNSRMKVFDVTVEEMCIITSPHVTIPPGIQFTLRYKTNSTKGDHNRHHPIDKLPKFGHRMHTVEWEETYITVPGAKHGHYGVLAQIGQLLTAHYLQLVNRKRRYPDGRSHNVEYQPKQGLLTEWLGDSDEFAEVFNDGVLGSALTEGLVESSKQAGITTARIMDAGLYRLIPMYFEPNIQFYYAQFNTRTSASLAQATWRLRFELQVEYEEYGLHTSADHEHVIVDEQEKYVYPDIISWLVHAPKEMKHATLP